MKVLVLSRVYPNNVMGLQGLWVAQLVRHTASMCEPRVVAPVPYCPPLPGFIDFTRFRQIESRSEVDGVTVTRPRYLIGPGYLLHNLEAKSYYWSIRRHMDQIQREFPFDLIHAHFTYPDGVVAVKLGRRYRVPVLITEHAPWQPWLDNYPRVRRQAVRASEACNFHLAVSRYVRDTIINFTSDSEKVRVIPVGVDGSVFSPPPDAQRPDPNQILYVGRIHYVKGVDILLRAMRLLVDRRPKTQLTLVGGGFIFRDYRLQEERLRSLAKELELERHVEFVGPKSPAEVAQYMRDSALLVLPSRAESFGATLVEALACGTPVVATRCGGPEDIVNDKVGILVPIEDPDSLASAIDSVLETRDSYDPKNLRNYALDNFAWDQVARRVADLYQEAFGLHSPIEGELGNETWN